MGGQLATGSSIYMASAGVPAADSAGLSSIKSFSQLLTSIAAMPLAGGTFTGNVLFTDNTYTIGAAGATRPSAVHVGTGGVTSAGAVGVGVAPSRGKLHVKQSAVSYTDGLAIEEPGGTDSFLSIRGDNYKFIIEATYQSTGTYQPVNFRTAGVDRFVLSMSGQVSCTNVFSIGAYTVATLPAASTNAGYQAQVTDSNAAASGNYGATVAGGGSNRVKVFSDGTNWVIA